MCSLLRAAFFWTRVVRNRVFLREYLTVTDRFAKKPGFLGESASTLCYFRRETAMPCPQSRVLIADFHVVLTAEGDQFLLEAIAQFQR